VEREQGKAEGIKALNPLLRKMKRVVRETAVMEGLTEKILS
jgi:hypothetical protein